MRTSIVAPSPADADTRRSPATPERPAPPPTGAPRPGRGAVARAAPLVGGLAALVGIVVLAG